MYLLWMIIIGGVAGVIAKLLSPSPHNPRGFILTILLGIVGSFVATWLGQALHWYREGQSAGLIGSIVGAVIVLAVWHFISNRPNARF
ncbi:MAG TPA: GlsB/YeaQ/YmgE family stress response membrane protein [Acetobacteraceae bacterium]|nr:GlsB/YeaQ/YmgE family stress response membrane protein [Acetobacteraceae bacterium]